MHFRIRERIKAAATTTTPNPDQYHKYSWEKGGPGTAEAVPVYLETQIYKNLNFKQ